MPTTIVDAITRVAFYTSMKCILAALLLLMLAAPAWGQDFGMQVLRTLNRQEIKFYEQADKIAGIPSCLKAKLRGVPIIGEFIEADETIWMRQKFERFLLFTPRVLDFTVLGERYDDAEHRDKTRPIYSDFLPRGGCLSPQALLENRLIGLDDSLSQTAAFLRDRLADDGPFSGDVIYRRQLNDRINALQLVRNVIGAPPRVTTEEEFFNVVQERGLGPNDLVRAKGKVVTVQKVQNALTSQRQRFEEGQ